MRVKHWTKLLSITGACALGTSLQAAVNTIDFNTDPVATGLYVEPPPGTAQSAQWRKNGGASGANGDGYLSITDSAGSQQGRIFFRDLENGLIVKSFIFECDLRMGGGRTAPADGFSLNYVAVNDPLLPPTFADNFAGVAAEASLPEEGSRTGLGIGFDTWQSGTATGAPLTGANGVNDGNPPGPTGIQDVVGISVRVNGTMIAQFPVPVAATNILTRGAPNPGAAGATSVHQPATYANLATNNANYRYSMQTGALGDVNGDGVVNGADETIAQPTSLNEDDTNAVAFWRQWVTNLTWEKFKAEIDDTGKVKISWKGNEITPAGGLQTPFAPMAGRLVFAARTGGNWQVHHVDNIRLETTPFTSAVVQAVRGNAAGFQVEIIDQPGFAVLNTNSVVVKLDGTNVTAASVVKVGNLTTLSFLASPLISVGTHNVNITYTDDLNVTSTADRQFIVPSFLTSTTAFAMPAGSVNLGTPGFNASTHMQLGARPFNDGNRIAMAERQLYRGFIDPTTDQPFVNLATATNVTVQYINFTENPPWMEIINNGDGTFTTNNYGGEIGNFRSVNSASLGVADAIIPGLQPYKTGAGQSGDTNNNMVTEYTAYLQIPAGYYTFGVNSDDGFRASFGWNPDDVNGQVIGSFNGGKGSSDVLFDVYVPTDGIYPFRLLHFEGGGGNNVEFFYIDQATQLKILVNDLANGSKIKAFTTASANVRPAITTLKPARDLIYVLPDDPIEITFTDGNSAVNDASIVVRMNGTAQTVTTANAGPITTVTRATSYANPLPQGVVNMAVEWSFNEGGNTINVTNTYSFRVLQYGKVPGSYKLAGGAADTTGSQGFKARVSQIYRRPVGSTLPGGAGNLTQGDNDLFPGDANRLPRPELLLANAYWDPATGQPYTQRALPDLDGDLSFDIFTPLNMNNASGGTPAGITITHPNSGIFTAAAAAPFTFNEQPFPGVPSAFTGGDTNRSGGGLDNVAFEFTGYVEMKAGSQMWAVNSDDGFIATVAPSVRDAAGVMLGHFSGGRGNNGIPLPEPTGAANPNPANNTGNSIFASLTEEDGFYPWRIVYWNGGGGINIEFIAIDKRDNAMALVGDLGAVRPVVTSYIEANANAPTSSKAYAIVPVTPTPWDHRWMQTHVGAPKIWGNTPHNRDGNDIHPGADNTRHWPNAAIGSVFANATNKTFTMTVNGAAVTPTVTQVGSNTVVSYVPVMGLPSNSTATASITYEGHTHTWSWPVMAYTTVPTGQGVALSNTNTAARGFSVKIAQHAAARGTLNNTLEGAERSLAGDIANVATPNPARTDGRYIYQVLNFNNNYNSGGGTAISRGNFGTNNVSGFPGWPFEAVKDEAYPGLTNNIATFTALEAFAYLQFDTAGIKRFGANVDDGFSMKIGTPGVTNGFALFTQDRAGGNIDFPAAFLIPEPGLYPVRVIAYDGGGGGQFELFTYTDDGNKVLVNSDLAGSVKAYYSLSNTPEVRVSVARTGASGLTVTWTGGGTLFTATNVAGPWTTTGDSDGSFTDTIGATGNKYYMVR